MSKATSGSVKQLYHVNFTDDNAIAYGFNQTEADLEAYSPRQAFFWYVRNQCGDQDVYDRIKLDVEDDTEQFVVTAYRFIANHYAKRLLNEPDKSERLGHFFKQAGIEPTEDAVVVADILETRYKEMWKNPRALRAALGTVKKQRQAALS